jgi:magnesium transporter
MTVVDREQRQDFVGTAAEHVHARVPVFAPDLTAGAVRTHLAGRRFDTVADVAVCRGTYLVGLARIEDVLAAADDTLLSTLMDPDPPVVAPGTDQEVAAWQAVQRAECSLAVVDGDGSFRGLVPPRRLVQVLLEEHEEDLARLGGFLHGTRDARRATEEPVRRRFWHRLPWLLVGLAGAMAAAGIVGSFEDKLATNVTLAFFLPGIVYMADAVGTQTETLVIRGLSVGVSLRRVVRREVATGLLVGGALAVTFFPFTLLYGEPTVALTASLALFAACSVATLNTFRE